MMKQTLKLMIEAERREGFFVQGDPHRNDNASVVGQVLEQIDYEIQVFGEQDPVLQDHYLMGPNYLPLQEMYELDDTYQPAFYGDEL